MKKEVINRGVTKQKETTWSVNEKVKSIQKGEVFLRSFDGFIIMLFCVLRMLQK